MALNVGINGFGRIGRIVFRSCLQNSSLKITAINDPAVDIEYICYLIKFDSTHGKFRGCVERADNEVIVDGHKIAIFREKLPTNIPWHVADVQYVVEASGMFTSLEKASGHLASDGVKRVIVTAPSLDVPMVILGVNHNQLNSGHKVISCASSTLYCLAPIINILEENFGVSGGFITSIHAMTPSLKPLDGLCLKGKHWRDHRSIHQNIIPATTGACRALGKIIPQVKDKMTGLAFRIPIVNVSVLDLTVRLKTNTTMVDIVQQIENAEKINANSIIKVSNEQAVSSDFIGDTYSCILDINSSLQLTPDFFKLICWYENEFSYACRVIDSIFFLENQYQLEWNSKLAYIRPTPKQSMIRQVDYHKKVIYHDDRSYECSTSENTRSLCSTSQDSGFKSPKRTSVVKKSLPSRNVGTRPAPYVVSRELKKTDEVFKIWNDDDHIVRARLRQNRGCFFRSCSAIAPHSRDEDLYVSTKARLNDVKKEISKMVSMTENLLKKSQHTSIEQLKTEKPSNDEVCDNNDTNKLAIREEAKYSTEHKSDSAAMQHNANETCETIKIDTRNDKEIIIPQGAELNGHKNQGNNATIKPMRDNSVFSTTILKKSENHSNKNVTVDMEEMQLSVRSNILKEKSQVDPIITSADGLFDVQSNNARKQRKECDDYFITPTNSNLQIKINEQEIGNIKNNIATLNSSCKPEHDYCSSLSNQSASLVGTSDTSHDKDHSERDINIKESNSKKLYDYHMHMDPNLQERLEGVLKKLSIDDGVSDRPSICCLSYSNTATTMSNRDTKQKNDIYDKLDSVSATDSENSFHMNERKSQVIHITDLTNSLEDLERLDKICRIMEISDDLSDQLLSALNNTDRKELRNTKWSFKNLCEKIKLDEFCNKMFSKSNL